MSSPSSPSSTPERGSATSQYTPSSPSTSITISSAGKTTDTGGSISPSSTKQLSQQEPPITPPHVQLYSCLQCNITALPCSFICARPALSRHLRKPQPTACARCMRNGEPICLLQFFRRETAAQGQYIRRRVFASSVPGIDAAMVHKRGME